MRVAELVVPHDLTALSDRALAAVHALGIAAASVHVIHVLVRVDPSHPALVWSRDEDEPRRAYALRTLRAHLAGGPWAGAQIHVRIGDPGSRIVELCREVGADLVALPSHGRKGLQRFVFGSVAEHVARFAPCPVLILPAAAVDEGRVHAAPAPASPDREPAEKVDALAVRICDLVTGDSGFLSALRIGLPRDQDPRFWEAALERRLAKSGVEFVDLSFTLVEGDQPEILDARFEPLPEERA